MPGNDALPPQKKVLAITAGPAAENKATPEAAPKAENKASPEPTGAKSLWQKMKKALSQLKPTPKDPTKSDKEEEEKKKKEEEEKKDPPKPHDIAGLSKEAMLRLVKTALALSELGKESSESNTKDSGASPSPSPKPITFKPSSPEPQSPSSSPQPGSAPQAEPNKKTNEQPGSAPQAEPSQEEKKQIQAYAALCEKQGVTQQELKNFTQEPNPETKKNLGNKLLVKLHPDKVTEGEDRVIAGEITKDINAAKKNDEPKNPYAKKEAEKANNKLTAVADNLKQRESMGLEQPKTPDPKTSTRLKMK